ncbi:hypothetical protein [Sporomusa sp. GT1]|uniref:hypothetical protein n=1 Tax=Sporomusa sp. GT1 TaxID=1534747 RepID=UPI001665F3CE|nr:hypothetical protein [Sporomusa sp. GT1]
MKQIEVVFCGNSLYLYTLAAVLQNERVFRVCMTEQQPLEAIPELKMLCPDVAIFEAADEALGIISRLHKETSCMMIIAVYPKTDLLEIFFDEQYFTSSVDDLVQVLMRVL